MTVAVTQTKVVPTTVVQVSTDLETQFKTQTATVGPLHYVLCLHIRY